MQNFCVLFLLCFAVSSSVAEKSKINWGKILFDVLKLAKEFLKVLSENMPQPEDAGKNITEILDRNNYPWEQHNVVTDDGYKLQIFNIPNGRNGHIKGDNKPVVFLMHGLLSSAADFINMGSTRSLGLILADEGYDVWLGNARGNRFGRAHVNLDPDKNVSFWNFSWHEQGIFDLPASIDYVLNFTNSSKLAYIGHSQGTTAYFVMGSEKPQYNKKVNIAVALAPVVFMQNLTSPLIKILADNMATEEFAIKTVLGIHEIPSSDWITLLGEVFCNDHSATQFLCITFLELIAGFDTEQINTTLLPVFMSNTPAGCAINQVVHYGQIINSGFFRKFDYGLLANKIKYGSITPPNYNLSAISAPMALYHAEDDFLAAECNVDQLVTQLAHVVENCFIEDFNHVDFIWATDANTKVYGKVLNVLNRYR